MEVAKAPWKTPAGTPSKHEQHRLHSPGPAFPARDESGQPKRVLKGGDADVEGVRQLLGKPGSSRARDAASVSNKPRARASVSRHLH